MTTGPQKRPKKPEDVTTWSAFGVWVATHPLTVAFAILLIGLSLAFIAIFVPKRLFGFDLAGKITGDRCAMSRQEENAVFRVAISDADQPIRIVRQFGIDVFIIAPKGKSVSGTDMVLVRPGSSGWNGSFRTRQSLRGQHHDKCYDVTKSDKDGSGTIKAVECL